MDTQRSKNFFRNLPKIELHRHLEGSLRLSTMLEIAREFDLDLPHQDPALFRQLVQITPDEPFTYQNFLSKFKTLRLFFRTPEIIRQITREAIVDAATDNVRHLEIRFTPVALGSIQNFSPDKVIDIVVEAVNETCKEIPISISLIASMNRHESLALAEAVTEAAVNRREDGIAGLDLAGDEANYSAEPFANLFKEAKKEGLRLTVHAGEWGGPENVIQAIDLLEAERIGHGVRISEDPSAMQLARDQGTVFEVCPTSNYQSGVCTSLSVHPMKRLMEAGLKVTLNTDDPGISAIQLTNEYMNAHQIMGFSLDHLRTVTIEAAKNAFLEKQQRAQLVDEIKAEFDQKAQLNLH